MDDTDSYQFENVTIAKLVSGLAELPPMMSVIVTDDDAEEKLFINEICIYTHPETGNKTCFLKCSGIPSTKPVIPKSYEELIDEKRELARNMAAETARKTIIPPAV